MQKGSIGSSTSQGWTRAGCCTAVRSGFAGQSQNLVGVPSKLGRSSGYHCENSVIAPHQRGLATVAAVVPERATFASPSALAVAGGESLGEPLLVAPLQIACPQSVRLVDRTALCTSRPTFVLVLSLLSSSIPSTLFAAKCLTTTLIPSSPSRR